MQDHAERSGKVCKWNILCAYMPLLMTLSIAQDTQQLTRVLREHVHGGVRRRGACDRGVDEAGVPGPPLPALPVPARLRAARRPACGHRPPHLTPAGQSLHTGPGQTYRGTQLEQSEIWRPTADCVCVIHRIYIGFGTYCSLEMIRTAMRS